MYYCAFSRVVAMADSLVNHTSRTDAHALTSSSAEFDEGQIGGGGMAGRGALGASFDWETASWVARGYTSRTNTASADVTESERNELQAQQQKKGKLCILSGWVLGLSSNVPG